MEKPIINKLTVRLFEDENADLSGLVTEYSYGVNDDGTEYLFIEESMAYTQDDVETQGVSKVLEWIKEDYKRISTYGNQWYYFGIVAEAEVKYQTKDGSWRLEQFKSDGLWGFESDAEDDTDAENEQYYQLQNLKEHLEHFNVDTTGFEDMPVRVLDISRKDYYSCGDEVEELTVKSLKPKEDKKI